MNDIKAQALSDGMIPMRLYGFQKAIHDRGGSDDGHRQQ
jgi:hypothetical protein